MGPVEERAELHRYLLGKMSVILMKYANQMYENWLLVNHRHRDETGAGW